MSKTPNSRGTVNEYSLFQNWVMIVLFLDGRARSLNELVMECCDSALTDDLREDLIKTYVDKIVEDGYVEPHYFANNLPTTYSIATSGILYVRKRILKPFSDVADGVIDYDEFMKRINPRFKPDIEQAFHESNNKLELGKKILSFGINHVSSLIDMINSIGVPK